MTSIREYFHQIHRQSTFFQRLSTSNYMVSGHQYGWFRQRYFLRGSANLFKAKVLWEELTRIWKNR